MMKKASGCSVNRLRRWMTAIACLPLAMLTGCPQQQAGAPGRTAPQATAPVIAAPAPEPPVSAAEQAQADEAAARGRKVQQLIAQVEGAYSSGVNIYRAGRLEAARSDFDLAVDTMLTSGMDLKADPQLSDELERLLNSINSLEMAALKQIGRAHV